MKNILSVDLEDWYHICGFDGSEIKRHDWQEYSNRLEHNLDRILKLFQRYNAKATFFVVGVIAKNSPALIKEIVRCGHEVATHGYLHRRIFDLTQNEFEQDLLRSKAAIEDASGKKVIGYRAPEWSLKKETLWALDILAKHGFVYDASAVPLSHLGGKYFKAFPYKIKTKYGEILEVPLSTFRGFWEQLPFSGGLPLRIVPYFFILDVTRQLNNRYKQPVVFYLHPWEFDLTQVKIDLPINRKFMHYCNLASAPRKYELLLKYLTFGSIAERFVINQPQLIGNEKTITPLHYEYFVSYSKILVLFILVGLLFIATAYYFGFYVFSLMAVFFTIWYWPWGSWVKLFIKKA